MLASGVASQADTNAFGGNVGAINNAGYRSAVVDLAGYQLGSLSPVGALANQMGNMLSTTDIGKTLGIEKSGNYNEIGTAMNQARNTALAELGLSNMSQVTTNAQYDAITASMVAAQTAAKRRFKSCCSSQKCTSRPSSCNSSGTSFCNDRFRVFTKRYY